jgi:hypothetical protein
MATWDFNDKQANFLDVLDMAHTSGPQRIKRGDQRLYVVSEEDWLGQKERSGEHMVAVRKTG